MFNQINSSNGVPVYEQVIRQVTFAVANRSLRPGELVPSVRQLARDLTINPNTVARAYRQLRELNVLETRRGTGLAVADKAPSVCRKERTRIFREQFGQLIEEARLGQMTDDEIKQLFVQELEKNHGKH